MGRIALFGGSFNPVHNGHFNLVKETAEKNSIDRVFVIPTYVSPFKKDSSGFVADGKDRLEMCRLAFEELPYVTVSDYEISQAEVSYSINTVTHFHQKFPDDELFFIMGSDMLLSFDRWYRYKDILALCTVIAASREDKGSDIQLLKAKAEELSDFGNIIVTEISAFELSSSEIREKIIKNCDLSCYMNENVVKYIVANNVYERLKCKD
ncbi:MAG: nicotinate (nicotinamide) nucleotide adenylyltransferase [Oscillospiraceae bacterium]